MPEKNAKKILSQAKIKVKEHAKKTLSPAKTKVIESTKTESDKKLIRRRPRPSKEIVSTLIILKIWLEGWKKTFTLQGRSSRFELWIFMLVNSILTIGIQLKCSYILSARFLRNATAEGYSLDTIETYINIAQIAFYAVLLIPLISVFSLLIRRMHDIGKAAWKYYLEPLCYGLMTAAGLLIFINALDEIGGYDNSLILLSACFCITLYSIGYYTLKFLITTAFYRGDIADNKFGKTQYNDDEHERLALKFSCFYLLFVSSIGFLYLWIFIVDFLRSFNSL